MGANYYLKKNHCSACDRSDSIHIGLSCGGWCFKLHVHPELGINTLDDWKREFDKGIIFDENDRQVSNGDMLSEITERESDMAVTWAESVMRRNNAVHGPSNLLREKIDGQHCIGHGDGTWDYLIGDFC